MKKTVITRIFALCAIAAMFSYCKKPTEFKEVEVNNLFTLQIPVYLHPTDDLVPFTSSNVQQYKDSNSKICLLVFDTARNGFEIHDLKTFYDSMVASPVMDSAVIVTAQLVKVDNDSTYQTEITGVINKKKVFSEIETIATKDRYYYIIMWASSDKPEQLKDDMVKLLNSFRDISHPKK